MKTFSVNLKSDSCFEVEAMQIVLSSGVVEFLTDGITVALVPLDGIASVVMIRDEPKPTVKGRTWGKIYDCGCTGYGGEDLPDYCPNHGHP